MLKQKWSGKDFIILFGKFWLALLPSFLVYIILIQPDIIIHRGRPVFQTVKSNSVHEVLYNTRWTHMRPCGQFFDEQQEFQKALQCVNEKVWPNGALVDIVPPRCFVVSVDSPDVFTDKNQTFNFIPILSLFGPEAIVGIYQPHTQTIFVVENIDIASIYRHELQHFFLHKKQPDTNGGGHHQEIWKQCEGRTYTPSIKAQMISAISGLEK